MELFIAQGQWIFRMVVFSRSPTTSLPAYFKVILSYDRHRIEVDFYRNKHGKLRFHVRLPLFRISNDQLTKVVCEAGPVVPDPIMGARQDLKDVLKPVVAGKIFGFKFGGE